MNNKKVKNIIVVLFFVGVIAFAVAKTYKESDLPEAQAEKKAAEEKEAEIEKQEAIEYIMLTKITYNGTTKNTIRVYNNGKIEQSRVTEDAVVSTNNESYFNIGTLTDDELKQINEIITEMKDETFKKTDLSDSYGLSIRLSKEDKVLYSLEYFKQEDATRLNNIISKY